MKEIITSAGETVAIGREPKATTLFAGATLGIPGTVVLNGRDSAIIAAEMMLAAFEVDHDAAAAALEEFGAGLRLVSEAGAPDLRFEVLDRVCAFLGVEREPIETLEERVRAMTPEQREALGLAADAASLVESLKSENARIREDLTDVLQSAGIVEGDTEAGKLKLSALVQERDRLAKTLGLFISTAGLTVGTMEDMTAELAKLVGAQREEAAAQAVAAAQASAPSEPVQAVAQSPTATPSKKPRGRKS